jgi:KDO2-lipid IV(A) lauroyltransferase
LDRPEKVVFITGHYGNFILGTRFVNATMMPVSAVVKRQSNYRIHQDFYRNLSREGMVIWENRKDLRKIVSLAIKDGESLGLMIDQDAGPRGMMIPFLNHPASTATGPFHLIRKFVPRVVVTSMHLEKNLNYHLLIKDLGYLNHLEGKEILTLLNNELSAYVMDHPLDWLWFHRRWKTQL